MGALLLESADQALDHAVLLRAVRRDELLLQAVAAYQRGVAAAGEYQTVVRAKQERCTHAAQAAKATDQCLFQGGLGGLGLGAARQMPTQQLSGMAIHHQGQRQPTIAAGPDAAKI